MRVSEGLSVCARPPVGGFLWNVWEVFVKDFGWEGLLEGVCQGMC